MYYAYIARCADQTLYSGYTNDLKKREAVHNKGKGARYTKIRLPVAIVYSESFQNRSEAMKREYGLKKMKKVEKEKLITNKV